MFLTRAQSAGRGTRGRSFESPEDAGLYMSLLLYPKIHSRDAFLLTCATAVAVCRAVEKLCPEVSPRIKWVNDVYVGDKKLCGILTEGECNDDGMLCYAIIGIGINIKNAPHSQEVESIMTSLENEGADIDVPRLAAEIISEILALVDNRMLLLDEYRTRSLLIGREVEISSAGTVNTERVIGIDDECALLTKGADNTTKRYISGDVKIHTKKEEK